MTPWPWGYGRQGDLDVVAPRAETCRIGIEVRLDVDVLTKALPAVYRALGIQGYEALILSVLRTDGAPAYSDVLWTWDVERMEYHYTPMFGRPDEVSIALSWDVGVGWVFRPNTGDAPFWSPLLPKDDPRNRPDQTLVAMTILVDLHAPDLETFKKTLLAFKNTRSMV